MGTITETGILFHDLCDGHADWSQATFGADAERGPDGSLKHLAKEVGEALDALDNWRRHDAIQDAVASDSAWIDFREELADCLLLILDAARRGSVSGVNLLQAAMKKLEKNRGRKWMTMQTEDTDPTLAEKINRGHESTRRVVANLNAVMASQPAPVANDLHAVWDLVMTDMRERDKLGGCRYGVRLQPFNGRDALADAYAEALDLAAYLRQAIYERDGK